MAVQHHNHRMFTYIYSLLIEKGICDRWNISSFHVFCVRLSSGDLFIFGKNLPFLFLFIVLSIFWYLSFYIVYFLLCLKFLLVYMLKLLNFLPWGDSNLWPSDLYIILLYELGEYVDEYLICLEFSVFIFVIKFNVRRKLEIPYNKNECKPNSTTSLQIPFSWKEGLTDDWGVFFFWRDRYETDILPLEALMMIRTSYRVQVRFRLQGGLSMDSILFTFASYSQTVSVQVRL